MPSDKEQRIARYIEGYFYRSGRTEFPTIRRIAKSLRMRQVNVLDIVDGTDGFMVNVAIGAGGGYASLPTADWTVEVETVR